MRRVDGAGQRGVLDGEEWPQLPAPRREDAEDAGCCFFLCVCVCWEVEGGWGWWSIE